jgi:hypothetical protein
MTRRKRTKGQTTQWPQEKRTKGQMTQWPQEKELKNKQHNGHKKKN